MPSEFDPAKSARNVTLPGRADLPFEAADTFDFDTAVIVEDIRTHPETGAPYSEPRFQALGTIGRQIVMLVFAPIDNGFRTISLRPASRKERKTWRSAQ